MFFVNLDLKREMVAALCIYLYLVSFKIQDPEILYQKVLYLFVQEKWKYLNF